MAVMEIFLIIIIIVTVAAIIRAYVSPHSVNLRPRVSALINLPELIALQSSVKNIPTHARVTGAGKSPPLPPAFASRQTSYNGLLIGSGANTFDISGLQARNAQMYASISGGGGGGGGGTYSPVPPQTRGSFAITGGGAPFTDSKVTSPLLETGIRVPIQPAFERPDHRCGPDFAGAKCGPARCCSTSEWCGGLGDPHCVGGTNYPEYNGPNAPIASADPTGIERLDARCGPNFGGAKCGPTRCCSVLGWCGGAGDVHCQSATNQPAYNGIGAVVI